MPWQYCVQGINRQNKANGISAKSVKNFAIVFHEKCPVINNRAPEKFFQNKLKVIFSSREYFDHAILEEKQVGRIVSRLL